MQCARHLQRGPVYLVGRGDSTLMYLRCCSWWCQIGVKAHALCWGQWGSNPHEFRVRGRWDRNRTCTLRFWRPTLAVVVCRRMSPGVGGHWGAYWSSLCFHGRSSPCSEESVRGRKHLMYGLIGRRFLSKPVRSVRPVAFMSCAEGIAGTLMNAQFQPIARRSRRTRLLHWRASPTLQIELCYFRSRVNGERDRQHDPRDNSRKR